MFQRNRFIDGHRRDIGGRVKFGKHADKSVTDLLLSRDGTSYLQWMLSIPDIPEDVAEYLEKALEENSDPLLEASRPVKKVALEDLFNGPSTREVRLSQSIDELKVKAKKKMAERTKAKEVEKVKEEMAKRKAEAEW